MRNRIIIISSQVLFLTSSMFIAVANSQSADKIQEEGSQGRKSPLYKAEGDGEPHEENENNPVPIKRPTNPTLDLSDRQPKKGFQQKTRLTNEEERALKEKLEAEAEEREAAAEDAFFELAGEAVGKVLVGIVLVGFVLLMRRTSR